MSGARDVVCAVDVGTSAVRAALVTGDGTLVRHARRERPAGEGAATFDADRLWSDVVATLASVTDDLAALRVRGVAIAGHVGTVLVDERAVPVGVAGGWADARGLAQVGDGWADVPAALRTAGRPAVTGGAVPLLCWLARTAPALHERVRWVLSPKDFLVLRLTDVAATDVTSAAYTLGSDVVHRRWSPQLLAAGRLGLDRFPPQHAATDVVGLVTTDAAALTGLPAGVPVVAGGPDGTVGAAAMVGQTPGAIVDVAGTTDVLTRLLATPKDRRPHAVLNPYLVDGLWSCGGATGMTGGAVAHWCRLLGLGDVATATARLGRRLDEVPAGCDGLAMVPLLTGSRFPDWRPHERGTLWGLTDRHSPAHVVRAAQEAASFVVRLAVDVLAGDSPEAPIVLAGGTARSDTLAQMRADVLGRTVLASAEADVSLHGATLLGLVGAGMYPDLGSAQASLAPRLREFTPNPAAARRYAELFARWCAARDVVNQATAAHHDAEVPIAPGGSHLRS